MLGFTITFRRIIALVLIPVVIAACHSWIVVEDVAPQTVVETKQPSKIRVKTTDEDRIEIREPRIAGDSLVGEANGDSVAVALADVTRVETREFNPVGTLFVVVGVGLAVAIIAGVIVCSGGGCAPCGGNCTPWGN